MERIKLNDYLHLDELVDPLTYFTEPDNGLSKIDKKLPQIFMLLRVKYGKPININGWWKHLPIDMVVFDAEAFLNLMIKKDVPVWSGYRSPTCKTGAKGSEHREGKAQDPKGDQNAFFKIICENAKEFYTLGLRRIENTEFTKGWCHMGTSSKNHVPNKIRIINPKQTTISIAINNLFTINFILSFIILKICSQSRTRTCTL